MNGRERALLDAASLILWRQVTQTEHHAMQPHAPSYLAAMSRGPEVSDEKMRDSLRALALMRAAVEGHEVEPLPECIKTTREDPQQAADLVSDMRVQGLLARAYNAPRGACPHAPDTMNRKLWEEGWDGFVAGR